MPNDIPSPDNFLHKADQQQSPAPTPAHAQHADGYNRQPPRHSSSKHSGWRELITTVMVLAAALLVAFGLITYVFQTYQVDGSSMETTLQNNDRLIVWKVPRTWARITGHDYIPDRGDVIIFTEDLSAIGQGSDKQLVKRVIGLPGDEVIVKAGKVMVYNSAHPKGFDPDQTFPYGKTTRIPFTSGNLDYKLGPHQLFVMGDNRTVSEDSRSFGPINANQIIGKLVLRIWPIGKAKAF
ncbi:MAG TPA: signal peptidase I [Candidatus Saccharimonadales bacterium]|nr:signal peptidase I [Candidatus Saccharimonadales bacterium]